MIYNEKDNDGENRRRFIEKAREMGINLSKFLEYNLKEIIALYEGKTYMNAGAGIFVVVQAATTFRTRALSLEGSYPNQLDHARTRIVYGKRI